MTVKATASGGKNIDADEGQAWVALMELYTLIHLHVRFD